MKSLILSFFLMLVAIAPSHADNHAMKKAEADKPTIIAIKYHADWCGSCQILGPAMKEAMAMDDFPAVTSITFDMTDDTTKESSAALAASNALSDFYNPSGKTGYVLLIDAQTKTPLAKITKANDAAAITAVVKAVAARS